LSSVKKNEKEDFPCSQFFKNEENFEKADDSPP